MFTAGYNKQLWSLELIVVFMITVRGEVLYNSLLSITFKLTFSIIKGVVALSDS